MAYSRDYCRLIGELERIVARHCSTGGIKNGENYRYPVYFMKNGKEVGVHGTVGEIIPADAVPTLRYKFGVHSVEIGQALEEILNYLADNYDLVTPPTFE